MGLFETADNGCIHPHQYVCPQNCDPPLASSASAGFTLIEVAITTGLVSLIALVSSTMIMNSVQAQRSTEVSMDFAHTVSSLGQLLINKSGCETAFAGSSFAFDSLVPSISPGKEALDMKNISSAAGPLIELGISPRYPGIQVDRIAFDRVLHRFTPTQGTDGNMKDGYLVNLSIQASKVDVGGRRLPGSSVMTANIPVTFWVDQASGQISTCMEP